MGKIIDISDKVFGRLHVLEWAGLDKHNKSLWKCKCACGKEITARYSDLKTGHTVSCGCWNKERRVTHGERKTRLYRIWADIKTRCLNISCKEYKDYGERGISLCSEWMKFEPFRDWAISNGYTDSLTIDRIDNDKGYTPENCRWATMKEQNRNQRRNLVLNGKCLSEWADISGINYNTLRYRIRKGWTLEKAISTTVKAARLDVEREMLAEGKGPVRKE